MTAMIVKALALSIACCAATTLAIEAMRPAATLYVAGDKGMVEINPKTGALIRHLGGDRDDDIRMFTRDSNGALVERLSKPPIYLANGIAFEYDYAGDNPEFDSAVLDASQRLVANFYTSDGLQLAATQPQQDNMEIVVKETTVGEGAGESIVAVRAANVIAQCGSNVTAYTAGSFAQRWHVQGPRTQAYPSDSNVGADCSVSERSEGTLVVLWFYDSPFQSAPSNEPRQRQRRFVARRGARQPARRPLSPLDEKVVLAQGHNASSGELLWQYAVPSSSVQLEDFAQSFHTPTDEIYVFYAVPDGSMQWVRLDAASGHVLAEVTLDVEGDVYPIWVMGDGSVLVVNDAPSFLVQLTVDNLPMWKWSSSNAEPGTLEPLASVGSVFYAQYRECQGDQDDDDSCKHELRAYDTESRSSSPLWSQSAYPGLEGEIYLVDGCVQPVPALRPGSGYYTGC